jgi:hypothetical protein
MLRGGINRILDDTGKTGISKRMIEEYGGENWPLINQALEDWRAKGWLRIIKPLEGADSKDIVVEMLNYVDPTGPPPVWLFGKL